MVGLLCFLLVFVLTAEAQLKPTRRVLIINDLGIVSSPGFAEIDQAILSALQNSPYQIELYHESLQLTYFPDESSQATFRESLLLKYSKHKPDVIIAAGSASLRFIDESHEYFRDKPIIFCTVLAETPPQLKSDLHFTGILGRLAPSATLQTALHLLPGTKHVVVVGGMGKFDEAWEDAAKKAFRGYESKVDFTYLTDLTMPVLLDRLRHLPPNTIVYHTSIAEDAAGVRFIDSAQAVPLVSSAANAPVFVMDDVDLRGANSSGAVVGGDLVNWADDAHVAGDMAIRVLNGVRPEDIPIEASKNVYMFDWRALKRWGLNENDLPPGSIVLNRQPSFWELYRGYILTGLLVLLGQTVAILGLLWQRSRRRKTEAELERSEEKFSKSFRQSPLAVTITSANGSRYIEVNDTFERLTGWKRDEVIGRTPSDIGVLTDPKQRSSLLEQLLEKGHVRDQEIYFRTKAGQMRTGLASAESIEIDGERCALSVLVDITERKAAEEAVASLSGRLIHSQEEERKRIARDLHDDYNQRLAVLAIDLDVFGREDGNVSPQARGRLYEMVNRVMELGSDLHSLSHSLHSYTLTVLGLVEGVRTFCEEFTQQQGVQIDFSHTGVPHGIPEEVALCFFRIVQEALRNVKKHSGADRAEVQIDSSESRLHLSVSDRGKGLDLNKSTAECGIGLRSMEERLKVLGGQLEVHSQPKKGTRIDAWVPLDTNGLRLAPSGLSSLNQPDVGQLT